MCTFNLIKANIVIFVNKRIEKWKSILPSSIFVVHCLPTPCHRAACSFENNFKRLSNDSKEDESQLHNAIETERISIGQIRKLILKRVPLIPHELRNFNIIICYILDTEKSETKLYFQIPEKLVFLLNKTVE